RDRQQSSLVGHKLGSAEDVGVVNRHELSGSAQEVGRSDSRRLRAAETSAFDWAISCRASAASPAATSTRRWLIATQLFWVIVQDRRVGALPLCSSHGETLQQYWLTAPSPAPTF